MEQKLNAALGRDTQDWRMLNSCPACFYKLQDELPLGFSYLASIDGNNSLKKWMTSHTSITSPFDQRQLRSDYWISRQDVDRFKHEVKARVVSKLHFVNFY